MGSWVAGVARQQRQAWPHVIVWRKRIRDRDVAVAMTRRVSAIDDEESLPADLAPLPAERFRSSVGLRPPGTIFVVFVLQIPDP
jgi:hypothetical protein